MSRSDLSFKRAGIAHLEGELQSGGMKLIWKYAPNGCVGGINNLVPSFSFLVGCADCQLETRNQELETFLTFQFQPDRERFRQSLHR